ncbi:ribonuclease P protein component [Cellulomonas composti]|uniref:Ribonuclease P protein component n=1 Tax=Cellulomonas composti TaxID=266130 RepID=A0A511JDU0_9CELL|nr:ribonuclease P protein component [Cellulomonas composti]GEL96132.1 ribonuclease P protein component [Cellulomonas composti]
MLPAAYRMRRAADFEHAVRRGTRGGRETLVVHMTTRTDPGPEGPVVGFVVSKAVGNAVVRNRTKRRLRGLMASRISGLPGDCAVVVRALGPAVSVDSAGLAADLDGALATAQRRLVARTR